MAGRKNPAGKSASGKAMIEVLNMRFGRQPSRMIWPTAEEYIDEVIAGLRKSVLKYAAMTNKKLEEKVAGQENTYRVLSDTVPSGVVPLD
jgi:hypothetical protein